MTSLKFADVNGWPFGQLPALAFDVVLADPPWQFELYSAKGNLKGAEAQYECMGLEEIQALPVSGLCRGDALCFLWATWPMLRHGLETLDAWGFRYVTGGAWHKRTSGGKSAFGTGYVMRSASEPFLIGTLGSPLTARNIRNVIDAETRGHSRKPDITYDLLDRLCPRATRAVELFARQEWVGAGRLKWSAWGNQTDKFTPEAA